MWNKIKNLFNHSKDTGLSRFTGKRVLTIDDDATQRTMIYSALAKRGFNILEAENGEKGLEIAQIEKPDLILLDVMMPGMNGNEICRRLKADNYTKDIPVIFLTSIDTPKEIIEHYDMGAEVHLTKPINAKELIEQVEITLAETDV